MGSNRYIFCSMDDGCLRLIYLNDQANFQPYLLKRQDKNEKVTITAKINLLSFHLGKLNPNLPFFQC